MSIGLSVIVPVFNRANIMTRTLDSVVAQSYRPLQLIIVDNNSADESLEVAMEWKSAHESSDFIVDVMQEKAPGACAARNKGLSATRHEIVAFFDSDDVMRCNYAESIMNAFERNPQADVVYWRKQLHRLDGLVRNLKFKKTNVLDNHIYHALLATQGFAIKTDTLRDLGGWNDNLLAWNDWELGIRILLHTDKTVPIDATLVDIYAGEDSITGTSFSSKTGVWERSIDAASADVEHSAHPQKQRLLTMLDYRRVVLAAHYYREGASSAADKLYKDTKKQQTTLKNRILLAFAYRYVRHGLRGCATLINPFI